ncbi:acetyl CoA:N6-hydroxylysine acetyl transferase [Variovorax sp. TBS-050B]|uniref:GNAT family N-acetyltransferase n=1 Tax=Variovorax sp. TBS-050B TaxID=2940551 RepID=UPI002474E399|nr:GNAT family N-acetyltransferase [Variovorax sp. TBS-050B]MDH6593502.1 acetyl CoA:N6-hydroxylysine acetyl transferase [Variovorax sp. TBS-050B]
MTTTSHVSYAGGQPHAVTHEAGTLDVRNTHDGSRSLWKLRQDATLEWLDGSDASTDHLLAALEAAFEQHPGHKHFTVAAGHAAAALVQAGVLLPAADGRATCWRDMLWQQPALWLPAVQPPMALRYALTHGKYHPLRPPKREGVLYQRFIPWLGKTFSFRSFDPEADLARFNRWMNDPDVAVIWEEQGDLDKHRAYLAAIDRDPHMQSMVACLDGEPFGYFETYWAKESRIAPFYDVDDHDRGWHVLIGEPAFRGRAFATAWLTSISHYIFLCDPRTRRAVGEPRIDHVQQIRNLDKSGYAKVKEFDLPHKRALLVVMLRERYFIDALWLPRSDGAAAATPAQHTA